MIEFVKVSLIRHSRIILEDVSFKIEPNQTVLLVGSSGAGKTTVLKLILGLTEPTSGSVYIMGQNIAEISEDELNEIRRKFGLVFQEGALFDSLTLEQNVGFFLLENFRLPPGQVHKRVTDLMRFLELEEFLNYYPQEISGGMKKRVAIARAVAANPQVLLYDEPTAGLDPVTAKRVVRLIDSLRKSLNHTSLIVTHELHNFVDIGDRLLLLEDGSISYDGEVDPAIFEQVEETEVRFDQKIIRGEDGIFK